jgi:hypothetical protein
MGWGEVSSPPNMSLQRVAPPRGVSTINTDHTPRAPRPKRHPSKKNSKLRRLVLSHVFKIIATKNVFSLPILLSPPNNNRHFEVLQPATSNPIVGSLPNWTSSMPRAIIHPKAAAVAAATAAAAAAAAAAAGAGTDGVPGDAGGVVGGLGLMNNKMDGSDIATMAASFPDPGPGFIPPHIYAASSSMYSSTAGGGFMDAFLSGNGQGIQGGAVQEVESS